MHYLTKRKAKKGFKATQGSRNIGVGVVLKKTGGTELIIGDEDDFAERGYKWEPGYGNCLYFEGYWEPVADPRWSPDDFECHEENAAPRDPPKGWTPTDELLPFKRQKAAREAFNYSPSMSLPVDLKVILVGLIAVGVLITVGVMFL